MALAKAERPSFSFNRGINSDASPLTFPPDFSTDEDNYELLLDGSRRRRRGLEAESDEILDSDQPDTSVVRTFKWRSVGSDPDINFHCVQIGSKVYFMDDTDVPSEHVRSFTLDLETLAVDGFASNAGENLIDMAFGRGHALVVGKYLEPHFLEYDVATDSLIATRINIRERDFQGVEDGVDNQSGPTTLTEQYQYNLINQGWIYGDVLSFFASKSRYPSKNMIPWYGYRRVTQTGIDPNDGTKEFSPDKLVAEIFQDAPAPRGHFVRNPFDTNITVEVETETVKNYVSLIKPAGHAHFDQLAPPGQPSQENGPNYMNLPSAGNPSTQTLLTFKFNNPHFLDVGDTITMFTESVGRIGSLTGDGNRNWEIDETYTVEAVVDDNTLSFYFPLTNDAAGWRTTWPYSYWPIMYAFAGGDVISLEGTVIDERPTAVAFFAGRAVFAGVPHPSLGAALFFSQVVEVNSQYGKCYQVADPTSDKISDIVATDGIVLRIPEVGRVYKLLPHSSSLIAFASNGIWEIGPGSSGYFTATSYSVRKLSDAECVNASSVCDAEGLPLTWTSSGIFAIIQDTNTGFLVVRSLTEGQIDTLFSGISEADKASATADYDKTNKRVVWVYSRQNALVYDTRFRAFTPWSFGAAVYDIFTTTQQDGVNSTLRFVVFDDQFKVATATSTDFTDFGEEYESYIVTGFDTAQNPAKRKQAPIVTVFSKRTELATPLEDEGGGEENPDAGAARFIGLLTGPQSNNIVVSELGTTWTRRVVPTSQLRSATYSPELDIYIAVGEQVAYLSTDTVTWSPIFEMSAPVVGTIWQDITWSPELGLFVAVGQNFSGVDLIRTSPDGFTWTTRTPGSSAVGSVSSVVWDSRTARFYLTIQYLSTHRVQHSPDGITWTEATGANPSGGAYRIAPGADRLVLSSNGDTTTFYSLDGHTWFVGGSIGSGTNAISYGNGTFILGTVFGNAWWSTDSLSWTLMTGHSGMDWSEFAYSPSLNRFVGVNSGSLGPGTYNVTTSDDGRVWTMNALGEAIGFNHVIASF